MSEPNESEFLFAKPEHVPGLSDAANAAIALAALSSRLAQENRTRSFHPDGRPENVAEHSHMLSLVAVPLAQTFFPHLDSGMVARYCPIHDIVEAYVGDTPTDRIDSIELDAKETREKVAIEQLCREYAAVAPQFIADIVAYEAQVDLESRFVRMVDKLMPLLVQLPDHGNSMRVHYSAEEWQSINDTKIAQFLESYPDQTAVIRFREEINTYVMSVAWGE